MSNTPIHIHFNKVQTKGVFMQFTGALSFLGFMMIVFDLVNMGGTNFYDIGESLSIAMMHSVDTFSYLVL